MIKKQTVGIRKDNSLWPWIVLALLGFFIGVGIVMTVAVHEMWSGGNFRYYSMQVYVFVGLVCAAIMVVVGGGVQARLRRWQSFTPPITIDDVVIFSDANAYDIYAVACEREIRIAP